jgi:predicted permease
MPKDKRRFRFESFWRDVKEVSRSLRRDPLFTIVAVVTLTLGLGANAAVFDVMHYLLFRSLPVPHPEQLVRIGVSLAGGDDAPLSGPIFDALRNNRKAIPEAMAWAPFETYLDQNDSSQPINGALISGNGFAVLRLEPELGRLLNAMDDVPGGGPGGFATVISYRFWRRNFGGSSWISNHKLVINGIPVTVVGVMPARFNGMMIGSSPDVVLPLEFEVRAAGAFSQRHFAGSTWLTVFGRRNVDEPFSTAAARLQTFAPAILREGLATLSAPTQSELIPRLKLRIYAGQNGGAEDVGFSTGNLRDVYRRPILAVQALACFLLLLCVVNLVALQFARSKAREHEFAIRASLGAAHSRMWMQLLIESMLIGTVGTTMALIVGYILKLALAGFLAKQQEYWLLDTTIDSTVVLTIFATGVGCMVLSGAAPAAFFKWDGLAELVKANRTRTSTAAGRRSRSGRLSIPLQVSVCMVLLVAAGLFLSTILRLLTVPMGFNPHGVLLFPFHYASYSARLKIAEMEVVEHLRSTRGVSAAALLDIPPIGGGLPTTTVQSKGISAKTDRQSPINGVGPGYLAVMRTRVMEGREFRSTDTPNSPAVCMLSRSAAHYFFPGISPLGKRLALPPPRPPSIPAECEIVGVTEDTKYNDLRAESPRLIYTDDVQSPFPNQYIVVRTTNVQETTREFNRIIHQESPGTRVSNPKLLTDQIRNTIGRERLLGVISGLFAILAVVVTGVGLYGFLSWSVVRRTSEIGIRMALGADARTVVSMISRETLVLLGKGVGLGAVASYLFTKLATSMLYGTAAADPLVFCGAVIALSLLGVLAAWIPARRAALLEPTLALRSE